jgi:tetratricopeptide (TPR) repeat protein
MDPKMETASLARSAATKLKSSDWDGAIADLTALLKLDSRLAVGYYARARAAFSLSEAQRATSTDKAYASHTLGLADINQAITLDDKNAYAFNTRAWYTGVNYWTSMTTVNFQVPLNDANKAIELDSKVAEFYNTRAGINKKMNNLDAAIKDYDKLIELSGDKPPYYAYYNRGLGYSEKNNHDLAIADFSKSIDLSPQHWRSFYQRAQSYNQKQQYDLAIADLNKVIANSTETSIVNGAKELLAICQRRKG